ncbi:heme oxygenase [Neosynchiropus ocellatus]
MDSTKTAQTEEMTNRDLSEDIKSMIKESHVQVQNTELMLSFLKGKVTLPQYKLLLSSLFEIYQALEEEMDRNADHPSVAPIYFPAELARLEAIKKDLEFLYGHDWREKIVVPAATKRYCQRLRQIGKENPTMLLAHAYTRYLGDLSGGQVLGRLTQKSTGLKGSEGLSFFAFPGVSSLSLFKQLYRGRMNAVELSPTERRGVLEETLRAFELNMEVFDGLQKMLSVGQQGASSTHSLDTRKAPRSMIDSSLLFRLIIGLSLALATVSVGTFIL